jgi:RNA polymerase sigma-70 factor (ECF subfamily)
MTRTWIGPTGEGTADDDVTRLAPTFEEFFEEHRRPLFGALCVITSDRLEAEEIAQDAFLKVWERWDRVALLERPDGYLFRVAMNTFRSRLRRARTAVRRTFVTEPPPDLLATVEDRDDLARVLLPLSPRQRAALVLTGYLGYSSEEAADLLGVKASTIRALGTQGRIAIREAMEGTS